MVARFGVLAQFDFSPGRAQEAQQFFDAGALIVEQQPTTTRWFAYRNGENSYGAFAVFATEADRDALLAAGGPRSSAAQADLFTRPPTFDKVDIIASRDPA